MTRRAACLLLCLGAILIAQEGHPLTGTWSGDGGAPGSERTHLTVIMNWDGKKITGVINPGPKSSPLGDVSIDFANWTVRMQLPLDKGGVSVVAEGKFEDLASAHRSIRGTWKSGAVTGDFRLTRD